MHKIRYIPKRFQAKTLQVISSVEMILEEYDSQGYKMTLRGIYYQMVSRKLFPDDRRWSRDPKAKKWYRDPNGTVNADPNYDWLGGIVNDARLAGMIDWTLMVDETRSLHNYGGWSESIKEYVESFADGYSIDKWKGQPYSPEVWVEKQALEAVVAKACKQVDIPYFSCRGYNSQTAMWRAAMRLLYCIREEERIPFIIHLGDHDPSGIDMSRDIIDRLELFVDKHADARVINFERIALNMDQILEYNPPPDPAKLSDSRCKSYIDEYGEDAWELDALEPSVIEDLILNKINEIIDQDKYDDRIAEENDGRKKISQMAIQLENISGESNDNTD